MRRFVHALEYPLPERVNDFLTMGRDTEMVLYSSNNGIDNSSIDLDQW